MCGLVVPVENGEIGLLVLVGFRALGVNVRIMWGKGTLSMTIE